MRLAIAEVFSAEECRRIRERLAGAAFVDGRRTAGWHARLVKHNLQGDRQDETVAAVLEEIQSRLFAHPVFVAATRPKSFCALLLSRYEPGMAYGRHVDDALMAGLRTDVSFTLFLSELDTYEGGELVIEDAEGENAIRLPAGSLYLYPSTTLHRVEPVRSGTRLAAVGWVRSFVREAEAREILFDLETARRREFEANGKSETFDLLSKCAANLLRRWADD